jgi:hypothetical protein
MRHPITITIKTPIAIAITMAITTLIIIAIAHADHDGGEAVASAASCRVYRQGDCRFITAVSLKVAQVPWHVATGHRLTPHATPTATEQVMSGAST